MPTQTASWNYSQQIVKFLESTRNKTYTIVGLTFISLILFGAFAIRPTIATIFKLQSKIESGRIIEETMQTKIDTLSSLQQQMYQNERKISLLKETLSSEPKIDTIIASVQLIAEEYSLEVNSITPSKADTKKTAEEEALYEGLQSESMDVELLGDPADLQRFVEHFEKLPRTIRIESIGYTKPMNQQDYVLNAVIYFFYTI